MIYHHFDEREDGRCRCGGEAEDHAIDEHRYVGTGEACKAIVPAGDATEICGYPMPEHLWVD